MSSYQIPKQEKQNDDGSYSVIDFTAGITQSTAVMGSVVKGASHIVGYNEGALKIGEVRYDNCVKIAATPEKCSWKYLGRLNDITALAQSSNTYQYYTAIKVKTEIDLPSETTGLKGSDSTSGLLLDLSIGQNDTYTPIQLSQYINTIANNGHRMRPYLYKGIYKDETTYDQNKKELNKVNTKQEYMDRVHQGFEAVTGYGLGVGYINAKYKPAGKTGTSQSFVDTNGDGKIDKETISTTFVAYAPYDDPKVSFTIVSPNVSRPDGKTTYQSSINKRLTNRVSEKYFEFYP